MVSSTLRSVGAALASLSAAFRQVRNTLWILLYKAALKEGISCLTVSQRLSLPQFHDQELKVGENTASGYVLREITETENQLASAT